MKTESGTFLKTLQYTPDKDYQRYLKQRYNILSSLIEVKEGDKILDAGCGDGAVIKLILDKKLDNTLKNIQIIAVDNSIDTLNQAKKNFLNYHSTIKFIEADITGLPFPDNYFTKTICFHVIEHLNFNELDKALRELTRITQKEFILGFPNKYSTLRIWEILSQEGIRGVINKTFYFLKKDQPLIIERPKYSTTPHVYYSVSYIKKILKIFGFYPQIIKEIYFPVKFLDISQKGFSVPFGHSVIIKSIKK